MPPLSVWPGLLPLARHYSSRKCSNMNISTLGKDCCLIVNSFEKKLSGKKTCSRFVKGAVGGREQKGRAKGRKMNGNDKERRRS
jgi:hypothetical protein